MEENKEIITEEKIIPVEAVGVDKAMKKAEVIREVAKLTRLSQSDVRDVLNAFTDIAQREMIVTGAWRWPGMPNVTRHVRKDVFRYISDIDKTILYPAYCVLIAKMPEPVKKLHREMFRAQNNRLNGTTVENWWEPYYVADGNKVSELAKEYKKENKEN